MKRFIQASSLATSLLILSAILSFFVLFHSTWLSSEKQSQYIYQKYLSDRLSSIEKITQPLPTICQHQKKSTISFQWKHYNFHFHCEAKPFFLNLKQQNKKFITFNHIESWLDIPRFEHSIYKIRHLSELPPSSEQDPKIVITLQDIDERLTQDFYGIIITSHYFNFTDKKIYGTIYSSHPQNDPNRRNLSFKRQIIQNLNEKYIEWHYLPNSRSTLNVNKTN